MAGNEHEKAEARRAEEEIDWPEMAKKVRQGRMYICFEEPEEPMVWITEFDNRGDISTKWEQDMKRRKGGSFYRHYAQQCHEDHPNMSCGFYQLEEAVVD